MGQTPGGDERVDDVEGGSVECENQCGAQRPGGGNQRGPSARVRAPIFATRLPARVGRGGLGVMPPWMGRGSEWLDMAGAPLYIAAPRTREFRLRRCGVRLSHGLGREV
jgi:hypothetical protein